MSPEPAAPSPSEPTPIPAPPKEPADAAGPLTLAQRSTAAARALHAAGIIDLDAGLALLEHALEAPTFDASQAVGQLRNLKPALFRAPALPAPRPSRPSPSATMAPAAPDDPRHALVSAAHRAALSGDRNAVLTYLRAKRALA